MNHYLCEFTLEQRTYFVIWCSDQTDMLLRTKTGTIAIFPDVSSANQDAQNQRYKLEIETIARYNFDEIDNWCSSPNEKTLNHSDMLNAWNMLEDAFRGCKVEAEFSSRSKTANHIYEKLFYGNNLPAITPEGQHFTPTWTVGELEELSSVLRYWTACLRRIIKIE